MEKRFSKQKLLAVAELCNVDTSLPLKQMISEIISLLERLQIPTETPAPPAPKAPVSKKKPTPDKYTKLHQLGEKGKEGTVFLVEDASGRQLALKQFAKTKSERTLAKEAALLGKAAEFGIAPKMVEYNTDDNYIVMEKLDKSLFDIMRENGGKLSQALQREMINIFKVLDRIQIFHADPSPLNFMVDSAGKLKIIDFGFAKPIDLKMEKEQETKDVNMKFMPFGFILKMKDLVEPDKFPILLMYVSDDNRALLGVGPQVKKLPSVSRPKKATLRKSEEPPVQSPKQRKVRIAPPPAPVRSRKNVVKKSIVRSAKK